MMKLRGLSIVVVAVVGFITTTTSLPTTDNSYPLIGHQVWQLEEETGQEVVRTLEAEGLVDVLGDSGPASLLRVAPDDMDQVASSLRHARLNHTVHIHDLAAFIQAEAREVHRERVAAVRAKVCTSTSCGQPLTDAYMTFQEMEYYLQDVSKSPKVELRSIGKSVEGRGIWLLHIRGRETKGRIARNETERRSVWIHGGLHAREWISPAVVLNLIHNIMTEGSAIQDTDFYIVPMTNPDGYTYTWTQNRMWRKNKAKNSGSSCLGVDLNRNWDTHWGIGASNIPCSDTYMGSNPFSEPETQALREEMIRVGKFNLVLTFHSFGQIILYPWGGTTQEAPDTPEMKRNGLLMAASIKKASGNSYRVDRLAGGLYTIGGNSIDWAKKKLETKYVYTIELRDKGGSGFKLSSSQILPTVKEVWAGLKDLLVAIRKENSP